MKFIKEVSKFRPQCKVSVSIRAAELLTKKVIRQKLLVCGSLVDHTLRVVASMDEVASCFSMF